MLKHKWPCPPLPDANDASVVKSSNLIQSLKVDVEEEEFIRQLRKCAVVKFAPKTIVYCSLYLDCKTTNITMCCSSS